MTDVLVKPAFQSAFTDSGDATKFGPSAWNAARLFSAGTGGDLLIRDAASATGASWATGPPMGTSTGIVRVGGVLSCNVTPASNVGTAETDLMTYSLPANALSANTKGVRITVWGSTAANANSKAVRLYFGATQVSAIAGIVTSATGWHLAAIVVRTGAAAQTAGGTSFIGNNTGGAVTTTPTETLSGIVVIKITGTSAVGSSDVTANGMLVEALP